MKAYSLIYVALCLVIQLPQSSSERLNSLRTILEINDSYDSCSSNWDTFARASRYTHFLVKSLSVDTSDINNCRIGAPQQQCIPPNRLIELRDAGVTTMAVIDPSVTAAVWTQCLDSAQKRINVARSIAQAVVPDSAVYAYGGVVFKDNILSANAEILNVTREYLPYSADIAIHVASTALDFNAASPLLDALQGLLLNARFVIAQYTGTDAITNHYNNLGNRVGYKNAVVGVCYGTGDKCMTKSAVLLTFNATPYTDVACMGGYSYSGNDNAFEYDTTDVDLVDMLASKRAKCYVETVDTLPCKDTAKGMLAGVFFSPKTVSSEGTSVLPASLQMDSGSYLSNMTAWALDLEDAPRYPHATTPLQSTFDPKVPDAMFGFSEEWGCLDQTSGTTCAQTTDPNGVIGYTPDSLQFLKIGVGMLERPESLRAAAYNRSDVRYRVRELTWIVTAASESEFSVSTSDEFTDGTAANKKYGYTLLRTYKAENGVVKVSRTLTNTGDEAFTTSHISSAMFKVDNYSLLSTTNDDEDPQVYKFLVSGTTPTSNVASSFAGVCTEASELCKYLAGQSPYFVVTSQPQVSTSLLSYVAVCLLAFTPLGLYHFRKKK